MFIFKMHKMHKVIEIEQVYKKNSVIEQFIFHQK